MSNGAYGDSTSWFLGPQLLRNAKKPQFLPKNLRKLRKFGKSSPFYPPSIGDKKDCSPGTPQVKGALNEMFERLDLKRSAVNPVGDSMIPDSFIFALKETVGFECMTKAENELYLNSFLKKTCDETTIEIPLGVFFNKNNIKNLQKKASQYNFTFFLPELRDKFKQSPESAFEFYTEISFYTYRGKAFQKKWIVDIITNTGVFDEKKSEWQGPIQPDFFSIWMKYNRENVNTFLLNIKATESNPYTFAFNEETFEFEQIDGKTESGKLSNFSQKFSEFYELEFNELDAARSSEWSPYDEEKIKSEVNPILVLKRELYDFWNTYYDSLLQEEIGNLSSWKSLKTPVGYLGSKLVYSALAPTKLLAWLSGNSKDTVIEKIATGIIKSILSDILKSKYQDKMLGYIFADETITYEKKTFYVEETLKEDEYNWPGKHPINKKQNAFDTDTLVMTHDFYPTVAFVRGTAVPTSDLGVLREWGSNATVASGGDSYFYLTQVGVVVKWLLTEGKEVTDIVGHSRGAGIAYSAAMVVNNFFEKNGIVRRIEFCGLDGAITLPLTVTDEKGKKLKPQSIFSRNINMLSILDGALLDPLGKQERVGIADKKTEEEECKKQLLRPTNEVDKNLKKAVEKTFFELFDFSDVASIKSALLSFTSATGQGLGHDAGAKETGYQFELNNKIQGLISTQPKGRKNYLLVCTGFKNEDSDNIQLGILPEDKGSKNFKSGVIIQQHGNYEGLNWLSYYKESKEDQHWGFTFVRFEPEFDDKTVV